MTDKTWPDQEYQAVVADNERLRAALEAAPRPAAKTTSSTLVIYMDWFYQVRCRALEKVNL